MKTLKATQFNPSAGKVQIFCRIDGKFIYFKFNSNQYASQMIAQMKNKGADIQLGKHNTWIRIDIIKDNDFVQFGDVELNIKEMSNEQIEDFLVNFYKQKYEESKFQVEVI